MQIDTRKNIESLGQSKRLSMQIYKVNETCEVQEEAKSDINEGGSDRETSRQEKGSGNLGDNMSVEANKSISEP